ncbi:hypothetical protein [Streptomyces sp. UNOC14_S4]|uniref:hypothetical protein n=1 Tax=Streptomyces sp. UNOC14_S4 TaxID=2872340 RepID=UPI001E4FA6C0|nr:hypothetical protein [Streptomyces sp. UNOC14_S4]MCC3769461.1 hypothetical protein [Streptomyces sp. UNOC14_S4]
MPGKNLEAAQRWLASADNNRAHADQWFTNAGVAILPVGKVWDAIRVDKPLAGYVLAAQLPGPVIRDGEDHYFLVAPGSASRWTTPGSQALGPACYVAVPAPEHTKGPGIYWVQPPDGSGLLVDSERLAALVQEAYGEVTP